MLPALKHVGPPTVTFSCPACKQGYRVPDEFAGRQTICRTCGTRLAIPAATAGLAKATSAATAARRPAAKPLLIGGAIGGALLLALVTWLAVQASAKPASPGDRGAASGFAVAPAADPEKLYRQLADKVAKAKTLHVACDIEFDGKAGKAALYMAGNKYRIEMEDKKEKLLILCNGTQVAMRATDKEVTSKADRCLTAAEIKELCSSHGVGTTAILSSLAIAFAELAKDLGDDAKASKKDKAAPGVASDFRLGPLEKLGQQEAQCITYKYGSGKKTDALISLWLDPKTGLPVKRVCKGDLFGKEASTTETYTKFAVDEKVEDKLFLLPKPKGKEK